MIKTEPRLVILVCKQLQVVEIQFGSIQGSNGKVGPQLVIKFIIWEYTGNQREHIEEDRIKSYQHTNAIKLCGFKFYNLEWLKQFFRRFEHSTTPVTGAY